MRALSYVLTILLAAGLFFTFSRGAGLAVIAGLVVFGVGLAYKRRWPELKIALSVLGVVAVFVAVLAFSYQSIVMTRLSGNTRLENKSNQERISSYARAGSIIKQNPFFGVGVGNYTLALSQTSKDPLTWSYQPVHNTFLLIWAEIGVVGFFFLVGLILYLAVQSLRQGNITNLAILTSLVIMLMVDHWWWSLHFGMLFLGLVLRLLFKNLKSNK